jgi:flagellar basal body-associated protein FliL
MDQDILWVLIWVIITIFTLVMIIKFFTMCSDVHELLELERRKQGVRKVGNGFLPINEDGSVKINKES